MALYDCQEPILIGALNDWGVQQQEVIVTGLVPQLPALSERNGSRAAYRIESERIEGLHHAQQ